MFNKKNIQIIFFWLFMVNTTHAKIIDIEYISNASSELLLLDQNDLITIDVRNVIFSAKDVILTKHYKKEFKLILSDLEKKLGDVEADRLHSIILNSYEPKIVDSNMSELIKKAQEKQIKVIAVTSGKIGKFGVIKSREDLRIETLKDLGFDFSSSFDNNCVIDNKLNIAPIMFKNGVLFTSNALKGDCLGKFLNHIKFKPKKLIHIDNSMKMLVSMEKYCNENGIEFLGIHFTKIFLEKPGYLDQKFVDKQFEILQNDSKWISDSVAKCMIEQCKKIIKKK